MKAKRRQELKTNDLAQWLEDMRISLRDWGVYVLLGVAAVVLIAVVISYRSTAKQDAIRQSYASLSNLSAIAPQGVPKSNEELRQSLDDMGRLAAESADSGFKLDALTRKGEMALQLAERGEAGVDKEYLESARAAFKEVADGYRNETIYYARAVFGLFQVEADLFAVDGDEAHKTAAKGYLEKLRDDDRLRGTPFQTKAIDWLNELDEMFTQVTLPAKPVAAAQSPISISPVSVTPSADSRPAPSASVTIGSGENAAEGASGEPAEDAAGAPSGEVDAATDADTGDESPADSPAEEPADAGTNP